MAVNSRLSRVIRQEHPPLLVGVAGGRPLGRRDHRADLPVAAGVAGVVERRPLPARGAAGLRGVGAAARDRHEPRQRGGVQLLPPAADGSVHDRRRPQLGRADDVPGRGDRGQRRRRAGAHARVRGRAAPPGGRPVGRSGAHAARRRAGRDDAPRRRATPRGRARPRVGEDRARDARTDGRCTRFVLRRDSEPVGTLVVPGDLPTRMRDRLETRVVPSLEALLGAALERERLQAEVVETQALRRSDELKTALLRSISHDLRTPLTAILTAGSALVDGRALARGPRGARPGDRRGGRAADRPGREAARPLAAAGRRRRAAPAVVLGGRDPARGVAARSTPTARGSRCRSTPTCR